MLLKCAGQERKGDPVKKILSLFIAVLMTGLLPVAFAEEALIDQAEFTRLFCRHILEAMPDASVEQTGDDLIDVITADDNAFQLGTNNAYKQYLESPADLQTILSYYVKNIVSILRSDPEEERSESSIMPVIRSKDFLDGLESDAVSQTVYEEWTESLLIVYVWDFSTRVRYVMRHELEELGIQRDTLFETACQNLSRLSKNLQWREDNGRYYAELDGMYETSLPLLPIWSAENFPAISGDMMIAMPQRGSLVVFGSEDSEMMIALIGYLHENYESLSYPVLNGVLRLSGAVFEEALFVEADE